MAISDCWSDVLRSKYLTSLVLFHDYRKGLYTPGLDRFARTVGMGANAWQSGVPGKSTVPLNGGSTYVVDGGATPELELTTAATIIAFIRPGGRELLGGRRFIYKITGAGGYDFVAANTSQFAIYTNGVGSLETGSSSLIRTVSACVSWTTGLVPRFYGNGNFRSLGNNIAAPSAEQGTLYIGSAAGGLLMPAAIQSLLLFNEQLTGAEISQLHNDFMESAHYL